MVVDGRDSEVFGRFFGVRDRVRREWEFPAGLGVEEALVLFAGEHADMRADGLGVVDGEEWLGIVWLDWSLLENTDTVDVELAVESRYRRRGIGSRLLDEVIERARSDGRTRLSASVIADAVTGESAGTAFAGARGFVRKHSELHQVLELPLSAGQIDGLDRPVAGYEIVQWREHAPDEWVEQFADALRAMSEDVPQGEAGWRRRVGRLSGSGRRRPDGSRRGGSVIRPRRSTGSAGSRRTRRWVERTVRPISTSWIRSSARNTAASVSGWR